MKEPFYGLHCCLKGWKRVGSLMQNTIAKDAEEGNQSAIYGTRAYVCRRQNRLGRDLFKSYPD